MARHHRKLLRRLRALYPIEERRGVVVERMPGGCWRVRAGRAVVGGVIAWCPRRVDALREALRRRSGEARVFTPVRVTPATHCKVGFGHFMRGAIA